MKRVEAALHSDRNYAPVVILAHEWGHAADYWYRHNRPEQSWLICNERDHAWRANTFHRFAEEVFRSIHIPPLTEIKIDRSPDFIHRPVQIGAPALHLYICLVTAPRSATERAYRLQRFANSGTYRCTQRRIVV